MQTRDGTPQPHRSEGAGSDSGRRMRACAGTPSSSSTESRSSSRSSPGAARTCCSSISVAQRSACSLSTTDSWLCSAMLAPYQRDQRTRHAWPPASLCSETAWSCHSGGGVASVSVMRRRRQGRNAVAWVDSSFESIKPPDRSSKLRPGAPFLTCVKQGPGTNRVHSATEPSGRGWKPMRVVWPAQRRYSVQTRRSDSCSYRYFLF
jgi:hypothetical protein